MIGGCGAIPVKTIELALIEKYPVHEGFRLVKAFRMEKETNMRSSLRGAHEPEIIFKFTGNETHSTIRPAQASMSEIALHWLRPL
jgi:hypothetical protein